MQDADIDAVGQALALASEFASGDNPRYKVSSEAEALRLATHRHYKGGLYRRLFEAKHTETGDMVTIYVHIWPHNVSPWARPMEMFHGRLEDERVRFMPLESSDPT